MTISDKIYEKLERALVGVGFVNRISSTSDFTTDPSVGSGTGAPSTAEPSGSLYQRLASGTDGGAYHYRNSGWRRLLDALSSIGAPAQAILDWYSGSVTPAADSAAGVHAGVAATAANAFPGPFTNPDVPRSLQFVFGAGWDGGDVVVTGTDQFDAAATETITNPGAGGGIVYSAKAYKTVTAATKGAIGASGATCSIGRHHKIGITKLLSIAVGVLTRNAASELATFDATNNTFQPSNLPNGSAVYRWAVPTAAAHTHPITP